MDRGSILTKLSIVAYCIASFILKDYDNVALFILGMLCYVSLNMLYHITKRVRLKNLHLTLSIMLVILCYIYINPCFMLLLPVHIYEVFVIYSEKQWIGLALTFAAWIHADLAVKPELLLVSILSFFMVVGFNKSLEKISYLQDENDSLRSKNEQLHNSIHRDMEQKSQLMYLTQLEERNKIAQEIHDNIGHTLSGSLFQLEAVKLLIDVDKDKSKSMLTSIIEVLRVGMEGIRATLRNIKPPSELLGYNKLKFDLDTFTSSSSIKTSLVHEGDLNIITFTQWKIIQQNIKEILTNTIKYSMATAIAVRIDILNKYVKIEAKDNGQGASKIHKGLGIRGMEERCENLGGKVIIDGSKGFSVIMLLPLESK